MLCLPLTGEDINSLLVGTSSCHGDCRHLRPRVLCAVQSITDSHFVDKQHLALADHFVDATNVAEGVSFVSEVEVAFSRLPHNAQCSYMHASIEKAWTTTRNAGGSRCSRCAQPPQLAADSPSCAATRRGSHPCGRAADTTDCPACRSVRVCAGGLLGNAHRTRGNAIGAMLQRADAARSRHCSRKRACGAHPGYIRERRPGGRPGASSCAMDREGGRRF
jgi:hypothetical protein